jgi:glycosyltransferase involved in cell wall biosynthesis
MKILFYYFNGEGGAFSNVRLLLSRMAGAFPEDKYILAGRRGMDYSLLVEMPNVRFLPVANGIRGEMGRLWMGVFGLGRLVTTIRPDVLWSLNLGPYRRINVPSVLSVHNPHQVYGKEVTSYHPANRFYVTALRWFFRRSLACSDGVLVQTELMAQGVRGIKRSPRRIEAVPKAVESDDDVMSRPLPDELAARLRSGPLGTAFTFLYVSTDSPHKNYKVLADAFKILAAKRSKVRLILTLDARETTRLCGSTAEALMRQGYLVPVGWVAKEHLRSLYGFSDACLMPSMIESLSSAHLEAMKWGKPQICADLPYARDLCGDAALYENPFAADKWANTIEMLMRDAETRDRLIRSGYERMKRFPSSWKETAVRVRSFLKEVASLQANSSMN